MRKFGRRYALAGSLVLAACSAPASPPKKYPIPVPAAELRRLLLGHFIDERPNYPCDAGPLTFPTADRFIQYSQFGASSSTGTYRVLDGAVELLYESSDGPERDRIEVVRDANGTLLSTNWSALHPLTLTPIDADTSAISCGPIRHKDKP
ncbi:hypothetical protein ACCC88_04985 [Sphingomonas sp. Sphisp140]|uniref:hypothetical protein n=1 Tax=unclassified Sphingomonas TaxID=196159 RepID=UPI0039B0DD6E